MIALAIRLEVSRTAYSGISSKPSDHREELIEPFHNLSQSVPLVDGRRCTELHAKTPAGNQPR